MAWKILRVSALRRTLHRAAKEERWVLQLRYTLQASAAKLRPVFKTVLRVLRSHSNVQTHRLDVSCLLRYTAKYVLKNGEKATFTFESTDNGPEVVARRMLESWDIMEPQMWMILARAPVVRRSWKTKKCNPPLSLQENLHKEYAFYLEHMDMTVLEFFRAFKTSGAEPTRCKKQTQIAVGIRHVSFSLDLSFGQWLSMNVPHCLPQDLLTRYRQFTPPSLLYFASARELALETWKNEAAIRKVLSRNGDARHSVDAWLEASRLTALAIVSFLLPSTLDCI